MANEIELQEYQLGEDRRRYAYDIVQKLTYFIITTELVFCGYMLLNADKLKYLSGAVWIYSGVGLAAVCGLLWRFCYNILNYDRAHKIESKAFKYAKRLCPIFHDTYSILSIITLIWALVAGAFYLNSVTNPIKPSPPQVEFSSKKLVPPVASPKPQMQSPIQKKTSP